MDYKKNDRIYIRDLSVWTVIGVYPHERDILQEVILNLTLYIDKASAVEDFKPTVDYEVVTEAVIKLVKNSSFGLIEALAQAVAHELLTIKEIHACRVCIDKPGVMKSIRSVAVAIYRERN